MIEKAEMYVGIDVQVSRACSVAIIDGNGLPIDTGWFLEDEEMFEFLARYRAAIAGIGIDAPRWGLQKKREWYWQQNARSWRSRRPAEKGWGRHCEVVLSASHLANPQMTPLEREAPFWMQLGFRLFDAFQPHWTVHEVFPSASYRQIPNEPMIISVDLRGFAPGPKDMLDAYVSAWTVKEYAQGRGCAVGGGDDLGSIVLPRPIECPCPEVLSWPLG